MRRLMINADDFALTDGVCQGILQAMERGVVRATTAMTRPEGATGRITAHAAALSGRMGIHFQLTGGHPPCLPPEEVPSLVTAQGVFPRKRMDIGQVSADEIRREWRAQLDLLRSCGVSPSHMDTHHHVHKRPDVFPIYLETARELGIPARATNPAMAAALRAAGVPCADAFITGFFGEDLTTGRFLELVAAAFALLPGSAVVELMCHPGKNDAELSRISAYNQAREQEIAVLSSPEVRIGLGAMGVAVCGPEDIPRP
ncbi:cellobiose phosphotransferase system ydjc-like protein [hydrocarbon metagenome]|uniref:Cellobiose phosphotransferase system ydjc-like protein n=1 Tax=hydrocarbon metagenome TaxID=938273 RepID=A0A0W8G4V1_9ZZZZ